MKKHPLLTFLSKNKEIKSLFSSIRTYDFTKPYVLNHTSGSLQHALHALLWDYGTSPLIVITSTPEQAAQIFFDLSSMIGDEYLYLLALPEHHIHLLHEDIDPDTLRTVDTLLGFSRSSKGILITPIDLLSLSYPPPTSLKQHSISIQREKTIPFKNFTNSLMLHGFERKDYVSQQGEISIRGGIVDIFPMGHDLPIRIEFWGDEIESIREFDSKSQRSIKELNSYDFIGVLYHEKNEEFTSSLFDHISNDTTIVFDSASVYDAFLKRYLDKNEAIDKMKCFIYDDEQDASNPFLIQEQKNYSSSVQMCARSVLELATQHFTICMAADGQGHIQRFKELFLMSLEQDDVVDGIIPENMNVEDVFKQIKWIDTTLSTGFICQGLSLAFITEHQLFERKHFQKSLNNKRFTGISLKDLQQMHIGDYVVHIDKGVGQYDGLVTIKINEQEQECIRLIYHGGDVLFVHLNNIHKVQKYAAQESSKPTLSRLGSSEWEKKKQKTKKRIKDIARELIKLYAMRKSQPGFQFPSDTHWQKELEASFMYEDTEDQAKATDDVKRDMESSLPMDRLICGDVGFGKTEVAIRAAFKAVQAGKQVAILVPTTILAHQHFNTFSDRLKKYPIKVEVISRFRQTAEQHTIAEQIHNGTIDILIGTHRILSKDMKFKDLGLLIIDEEQRFGVSAKEKLRNLRVSVDTLTLTATPIPRTLNFSLMGARDLSIIETPPRNRLPISTVIHEWDDVLIHESLEREISRGGQIYVVNDTIKDLDTIHQKLLKVFPSLRCAKAHGQMDSDQLEKVMEAFLERKIDCLLSTKIVESGLDIPNANTIIINNADDFGLAELYQLRGRVGRSNTQAYCHLVIPPIQTITPQAVRRLQALEEFTELGSGFHLAMRDMEIRGAGNLLGAEQSGFIADMGLELYQTILEEAVSELKEEEFSDLFKDYVSESKIKKPIQDISIDVASDALLPSSYISHDGDRFEYYRRLYNVRSEIELQKITSELIDRYGALPQVAENLIFVIRLRIMALLFGFSRILFKGNVLSIDFPSDNDTAFYSTVFPGILDAVATGSFGNLINKDNKVLLHVPCNSRDEAMNILIHLQSHVV